MALKGPSIRSQKEEESCCTIPTGSIAKRDKCPPESKMDSFITGGKRGKGGENLSHYRQEKSVQEKKRKLVAVLRQTGSQAVKRGRDEKPSAERGRSMPIQPTLRFGGKIEDANQKREKKEKGDFLPAE